MNSGSSAAPESLPPTSATPHPLSPEYIRAAASGEYGTMPSQQDHMVIGGTSGASSFSPPLQVEVTGNVSQPPAPRKSRKKWWVIGLIILIVLLLAAGWVFGIYLPNKPENVWKTGLNRTGEGLNALINGSSSSKQMEVFKSSSVSGDVSVTSKDVNASGTFSVKGDEKDATSGFTIKLKPEDEQEYNLSADIISKLPANAKYPDMYFRLGGFKDLGLDEFLPGIDSYDGKWIYASSNDIKQYAESFGASASDSNDQLTAKDYVEVAKNAANTTNRYIFTSDPQKAVLENRQFVGKEKQDGINTYHYKVGINNAHAKAYCKALWDGIATTNAYKKLIDEKDRTSQRDSFTKGCQKSVDDIKASDQLDMWIDGHYKLIHRVRFYDTEDKSTYLDVGQNYKGGDSLELFATMHDPTDKVDLNWSQTADSDTNEADGHISMVSKDPDDAFTLEAHYKVKMDTQKLKIEAPANATPLKSVLKKLGFPTEPDASLPSDTRSF